MAYTIKHFEDEPILMMTIHSEYRVSEHQANSDADARAILDTVDAPQYVITDLTALHFSLDDIIRGTNTATLTQDAVWKHPNIKKLIFVSPKRIIHLAAKGLNSASFGSLQAYIFNTVDEAIMWIRNDIATSQY